VIVAKMDVDQNQKTPGDFGVRGIPTMVVFKDGKNVDQLVGNHPKDKIAELLNKHIS